VERGLVVLKRWRGGAAVLERIAVVAEAENE
jgi:hypothetical protein